MAEKYRTLGTTYPCIKFEVQDAPDKKEEYVATHATGSTEISVDEVDPATFPGFARHRGFAVLLLVTGTFSWLAASLLVLERLAIFKDPNHVTACDVNPWISCGDVMQTPQAAVFGFPNPLIGVVAFAVVMTTGVAMLAGARFARWYWIGMQAGVTLGMAFIVWLWFQALFVIHILCPYCMVVWVMMSFLFVLLTVRNMIHGVIPAPTGVKKFLTDWAWALATLLVVACAASIFFSFIGIFTAA